ncbi:MAG: pheT [Methylocystaceae bacterium]|nr:MAG: pheT [Methylocystaceae bacterium]
MKLTLSWLKEHLDTSASLSEIVETLTRIGLEVATRPRNLKTSPSRG